MYGGRQMHVMIEASSESLPHFQTHKWSKYSTARKIEMMSRMIAYLPSRLDRHLQTKDPEVACILLVHVITCIFCILFEDAPDQLRRSLSPRVGDAGLRQGAVPKTITNF